MTEEKPIPNQILVVVGPSRPDDRELEPRYGTPKQQLLNFVAVDINDLQGQVNVFLQQLNQVMSETPEKVGSFQLAEFEVSAGISAEAKGGVRLALLANAEAGGGINAGLKFVFKRE